MTARALVRVALPFAAHALAREVDAATGLLLHTTLDLPDFVRRALSLLDPLRVLGAVAAWVTGGLALEAMLAAARARVAPASWAAAFAGAPARYAPLLLRPALTLLALASLAAQPTWPYGFTLPVALSQDWSIAQDVATVSALLVLQAPLDRWRAVRLPVPGALSLGFVLFLLHALLTPGWAYQWDNHPGNEPKTLRMAVALGHWLTLDVEGVSAPMEELPVRPLPESVLAAAAALGRHSEQMVRALGDQPSPWGLEAIRASPVTRQTIRGKDGGVFYVLAPGPSVVLAPLLRVDRALNLARGTPGRLTVTLLAWNALAAAVAAATFLLLREVLGRPGLSALAAGVAALVPPALLYAYQLYPEVPAAGAMAVALRHLLSRRWWTTGRCLSLGVLLAAVPWLHQKFLPLWAALAALALIRAVSDLVPARALAALALPQAATLYLIALYNFAITGSVRPDAVFQAWGFGLSTSRMDLGVFGLPLDARYGLFPYVPVFLLAAGGLLQLGRLRFPIALSAALVYFLTVAAADNWAGPISNLGRFLLPLVPVLALLAALALDRALSRPGVLLVAATLAGWSAVLAAMLWRDPHAANDCAVLLAQSAFAEGAAYIPGLYLPSWGHARPGTLGRLVAWIALTTLLAAWLRRSARDAGGRRPLRTLAVMAGLLLATGFVLERWPVPRRGARFGNALDLGQGTAVFVSGTAEVRHDHVLARNGAIDLLVRSRDPLARLAAHVEGHGRLRVGKEAPLFLPGRPIALELPLEPRIALTGRRGARETLHELRLEVERAEAVALRFRPVR
jgi:hypothetical protein